MARSVEATAQPRVRAPRADAQRNHDSLLAAAAEAYSEKGVDAPLEDIARRAGLGIGTLYRHFPTRDALNEAVYRREVEVLCDDVDGLLAAHEPVEALAAWMREFTNYVATKRGMAAALKSALGPDTDLFTESHRRITEALSTLLASAVQSGAIRDDVEPGDLLRAMGGICMATDSAGWNERVGVLINLLVDGLRYGAPGVARS